MDKVYLNHPDSDKGNLMIAYVTLDRAFSVTAFVAVSILKDVSRYTFTVYKHTV